MRLTTRETPHDQQGPQPHRQGAARAADHGDRGVAADADGDQEEEESLAGGVVVDRGGHVGDGERRALFGGERGEDLLDREGAHVRGGRGDQQLGPVGVGDEGAGQLLAAQQFLGLAAVGDGADVQGLPALVLQGLGEHLGLRAGADHRHRDLVRLGADEGAQVGEAHPQAHQQRGDQVEQDVAQRAGGGGGVRRRFPD